MALLGHASRIIVASAQPEASRGVWEAIGFVDNGSSDSVVRLTDGQILISLLPQEASPLALAYFAPSLQSVGDKLLASGFEISGSNATGWHVPGPGMMEWWIHPATPSTLAQRSGESSPILGYFDAIVIPVSDVHDAAAWAQLCGYFIADQWENPLPQVDLTDGIVNISFRKQDAGVPFLHFTADLDDEWLAEATEAVGERLTVHRDGNGNTSLAIFSMPDACTIMVTPDEY
ncbi:MAG: hypothetical protein NTX15_05275 [Candidatus Kapabacteria bacterium]|nr:hypothetical protein [Candidatus Kapabacteria bacterium]